MDSSTILLLVLGALFLIALPFFFVRVLLGTLIALWQWAPVIMVVVAGFVVIAVYFPV